MKNQLKTLATLALVSALSTGLAQTTASGTTSTSSTAPKKTARKPVAPKKPSVESQIQSLREDMQTQIQQLKQQLSDRDAQLQQAQQAAAAAQAAAAQAQQQATQQSGTLTENQQAVTNLQGAVNDLKTNTSSISTTIQDNQANQAKFQKQMEHPDALHYKGITISPNGSYLAGESVYRTHATGGDIPTAFNALPYEHADAYTLSEFYGTARQSRVAVMAEGKSDFATFRGYYEADWLGTGVSSNNNQSNSYVMRERVLWGQAALNNGWAFTGGQLWSLATEDRKGISNLSADIMLPQTIDPNYVPGFVWTRQYGFRVTKTMDHFAFGIAAENPQILYTATLAGNTPYAVLGSAGANGGLYNAAISTCSPSTSIVNYTNEANGGVNTYIPVYKTVNACTNIVNYSFNVMPDIIVKAALDPSFGHFEFFAIGREAHETVYPGETTNSNLYGGLKDIVTGATVAPALTTAGFYHNNIAIGGLGASGRVTLDKIFVVGLKGLYGPGVGRYGDSTLSDVTANAAGELTPLHKLTALCTLEIQATKRLALYGNYGGDYASRNYSTGGSTLGAPSVGKSAAGLYGGHWSAPSAAAVGYGARNLNNSACLTNAAPGYNGSSTGYYPGGSCGAQTKYVTELNLGYWFDFYRGEHGRLRQGIQYAYAVRDAWTGAAVSTNGPGGVGAKGVDNMLFTSFRYYLP